MFDDCFDNTLEAYVSCGCSDCPCNRCSCVTNVDCGFDEASTEATKQSRDLVPDSYPDVGLATYSVSRFSK